MILANDVGESSKVFGGATNEVLVLTRTGQEAWPPLDKAEVARRLILRLSAMLPERGQ